MTSPEGGFYSTQDADSEGEEGKFFVWTADEILSLLGAEEGNLFNAYYAVTKEGNFEGSNVLSIPRDPDVVAHLAGVSMDRLEDVVARGRQRLLEARKQRTRPGRDEKVITSWNGLMLASFAEAARVLDREDYREAAVRNADFILRALRSDGRLHRIHKDGQAKATAYLEDYAFLSDGLLALYEATFDASWFLEAGTLADAMLSLFKDNTGPGFYDTDGAEVLITRPRSWEDGAIPSGNSMAADLLLRLAALTGEIAYQNIAVDILRAMAATAGQHPTAFGHLLSVLNYYLSSPEEIAIVGDPTADDTRELLKVVYSHYRPSKVVALGLVDDERTVVPLLTGRDQLEGRATAYVCRHFTCQRPVNSPSELAAQMGVQWEG
jgi:uncharacterized protein YyaL (SSP411 family)